MAFLFPDDAPLTDATTLVEAVADGWWYSARLPDGRLAGAFMTDPDVLAQTGGGWARTWETRVTRTVHTRARIEASHYRLPAPPSVVAAGSAALDAPAAVGWIAAGDAAAAHDPLSGHGIGAAMSGGWDAGGVALAVLAGEASAADAYARRVVDLRVLAPTAIGRAMYTVRTVVAALVMLAVVPAAWAQATKSAPAPDFEKCVRDPRQMLQRAAAGQSEAEFCAGYFYIQGAGGVAKNLAEGARYFRRAADHGYVKANGYVGYCYKHGIGVAPDLREAERWYRRGAELGDPGAQNDLAVLLLDGGEGVKPDRNEAITWARRAADQNYPQAFNLLARIQATSQPQRKEPAEDVFDEGLRLYQSGNQAGAVKPFLAAAQAGNSKAQLQIGWHYEKGVGVAQSYAEAARWYRRSAEQGNSRAMKNLGQLHEEGLGVPEDWAEAAKWYRRSAELGDADGESALARAYQFGIGVPQNRALAIQWDQRAAAQGDGQAAYFARWLRDPTNNIGFRNDHEHRLVIAGRLRFGGALIGGDPAGLAFRNSRERLGWLLLQRKELDRQEAETMWSIAKDEYDRCQRARGTNCHDPGPPPR